MYAQFGKRANAQSLAQSVLIPLTRRVHNSALVSSKHTNHNQYSITSTIDKFYKLISIISFDHIWTLTEKYTIRY